MKHNKEQLSKLLKLVMEISQQPGNQWFGVELASKLSNRDMQLNGTNFTGNQLIQDLKRSKFYLKAIDKSIWLEALKYYSQIKYADLKMELVVDYKEMKIADKNDDIIEYTRRIVMQLENCLNAVCCSQNAHSIISANPELYKTQSTDLFKGDYSFFELSGHPKPITKISIQSKIFFVKQYYDIRYSYSDMSQMITIRNKSSHRGEYTNKEKAILEDAINNVAERKASYFLCFDTFWKKMKDLKK